MKLPKIGVVIVNYNNPIDTRYSLKSVEEVKQSKKYRVVTYLVNNGCTDLESHNLFKEFSNIVQVNNSRNLGFAGGNNLGIKKALSDKCTHLLLLNNDAVIESKQFFDKLLKSPYDITSPMITTKIETKIVKDYGGKVDKVFGRNTHFSSSRKADYYSGACLFIDSKVFKSIGLLDDIFFLYYEDVDFCLRAKKAGFSLGQLLDVSVRHKLSASSNKLGAKKISILAKSHIIFCQRHLPLISYPFYASFNLYLRFKTLFL